MKPKIRIHNPCNEHTRYYRYYNYFWDEFTNFLKINFEIDENRSFEDAHKQRFPVKLTKGTSENFLILECEYVIENLDNNEFIVFSVSDDLSHGILNEMNNPFLKKVLVSQFLPSKLLSHTRNNFYKYSPWIYFQSTYGIDLCSYYEKRQKNKPTNEKIYFRGTSLEDRQLIHYIDKEFITDFFPININKYFDDIITHKIALSIDGRGEFCYRDIECFAIGVPILRFEYESKFYNELIPNYHYISIPRPHDMKLYRTGSKDHAKILMDRYQEVINDEDFLNFISNNARSYYEKNCKIENAIKLTYELSNLNNWLI